MRAACQRETHKSRWLHANGDLHHRGERRGCGVWTPFLRLAPTPGRQNCGIRSTCPRPARGGRRHQDSIIRGSSRFEHSRHSVADRADCSSRRFSPGPCSPRDEGPVPAGVDGSRWRCTPRPGCPKPPSYTSTVQLESSQLQIVNPALHWNRSGPEVSQSTFLGIEFGAGRVVLNVHANPGVLRPRTLS